MIFNTKSIFALAVLAKVASAGFFYPDTLEALQNHRELPSCAVGCTGCFSCENGVTDNGDGSLSVRVTHCKSGGTVSWMCCVGIDGTETGCDVTAPCRPDDGTGKCNGIPAGPSGGLVINIPDNAKTFTINTHDGQTSGNGDMNNNRCGGNGNQGKKGCSNSYSAHCDLEFSLATDCKYTAGPTATDPAPVVTDPAPVATDPAPVATDPAPVATDPAPVVTDAPPTDPVTNAPPPPTSGTPSTGENPWLGLTLYEVLSQGIPMPDCGDLGQEESFQGNDLTNDKGECYRVNICHGNAGQHGWNRQTVSRDSLDPTKVNGHAGANHNDSSKNKNPDYFPGAKAVPNPNGAGANSGSLDGQCGFTCDASDEFTCADGTVVKRALPDCEFADCPTPDTDPTPTESARVNGDPHFQTFGDEMYDYHGECDLVLVHNPGYKNVGMDIHVRTKITDWWSAVETAAIKLGDDVMEVNAGGMDDWFHINGKPNEKMEDDTWYRTEIAGFLVRYRRKGISAEAHIYLDGPKERLTMKTYKGFVRVDVPWRITPENYKGAVGMLGSFDENGARNGRDGKHIGNHNEFGQEWQVREDELKLFNSYEGAVTAPEKCKLPEFTMAQQQMRKRRLAESTLSQEDIEKACAHLPENQRSACEYDVIATQDIDMASVW